MLRHITYGCLDVAIHTALTPAPEDGLSERNVTHLFEVTLLAIGESFAAEVTAN